MTATRAELETATPQEILAWALDSYRPRAAMTSSFGVESPALLHIATRIHPAIPVIFLDTGFLFAETLRFAQELTDLLGLNLRVYRASPSQVEATRRRLQKRDNVAGRCCDDVKASLLRQALTDVDCWISGLRRDQSPVRSRTSVVETLENGVVKVNPLATWSGERARAYMADNGLPFHPLWYRGYTSIGCEPCTVPPVDALDSRSGRWPGLQKTECGIHTVGRRGC